MKKRKQMIIFIAFIIILLNIIIGSVFLKNDKKIKNVKNIVNDKHETIDESYSTVYIDTNKKELMDYIGSDFLVVGHKYKQGKKDNLVPEYWNILYKNTYTNNDEIIQIYKTDDVSIKEQITQQLNEKYKKNFSTILGTKNEPNSDILIWSAIDSEISTFKLNELTLDTIINSYLSFSDFGIYFKENNTKENIEKKYGDKIKQIYNYIGKNSKIFRIIIYNKTYQITKDSFDNLIWTLDEDYAKTDDSTN